MALSTKIICYLFVLVAVVLKDCLGRICIVSNMQADCRYKFDHYHLSVIKVTINRCEDPLSVKISITKPQQAPEKTDTWEATVAAAVDRREVEGYASKVFMLTQQGILEDGQYKLQVDFIIENQEKVEFIDEPDINLRRESCINLNKKAIIAVSVLTPICFFILIAILVFIYLRRKQKKMQQRTQNNLVLHSEPPSYSSPPHSVAQGQDMTMDSDVTNDIPSVAFYNVHVNGASSCNERNSNSVSNLDNSENNGNAHFVCSDSVCV